MAAADQPDCPVHDCAAVDPPHCGFAQLLDLAPTAKTWVDLGSGAGFPGLVIGCAVADIRGARIEDLLVESNGKKAAFLREAVRVTGAPVQVHAGANREFRGKLHWDRRYRHGTGAGAA